MTSPEQKGRAPKNEGKKSPEYPPKDITKLIYWSFLMAQGSGLDPKEPELVHTQIFPALLGLNPELAVAAKRWTKSQKWAKELKQRNFEDEDTSDDSDLVNNFLIEQYVDEVIDHRESDVAHAQGALDFMLDHRAEAYKALKYFLAEVDTYTALSSAERKRTLEGKVGNLARLVINRDAELLRKLGTHDPASLLQGEDAERRRKMKGYSMFCLFALSGKREEYRSFLPPAMQNLWEELGNYVRAHPENLPPETRENLHRLMEKFSDTMGEEIVLSTTTQ